MNFKGSVFFFFMGTSLTHLCNCPDVHCWKHVVLTLSGKNLWMWCRAPRLCVQLCSCLEYKQKRQSKRKKSEWEREIAMYESYRWPPWLRLSLLGSLTLLSFVPFPSWPPSQRRVASQTQASTCNVMHKYTQYINNAHTLDLFFKLS